MTRACFLDCPGNNCGGMLGVTVEKKERTYLGAAPETFTFRLTADPRSCPSCKSDWRVTPFPCPDQQTLAEAWAKGEAT